jgi:hypothetical protein
MMTPTTFVSTTRVFRSTEATRPRVVPLLRPLAQAIRRLSSWNSFSVRAPESRSAEMVFSCSSRTPSSVGTCIPAGCPTGSVAPGAQRLGPRRRNHQTAMATSTTADNATTIKAASGLSGSSTLDTVMAPIKLAVSTQNIIVLSRWMSGWSSGPFMHEV